MASVLPRPFSPRGLDGSFKASPVASMTPAKADSVPRRFSEGAISAREAAPGAEQSAGTVNEVKRCIKSAATSRRPSATTVKKAPTTTTATAAELGVNASAPENTRRLTPASPALPATPVNTPNPNAWEKTGWLTSTSPAPATPANTPKLNASDETTKPTQTIPAPVNPANTPNVSQPAIEHPSAAAAPTNTSTAGPTTGLGLMNVPENRSTEPSSEEPSGEYFFVHNMQGRDTPTASVAAASATLGITGARPTSAPSPTPFSSPRPRAATLAAEFAQGSTTIPAVPSTPSVPS